MKLRKSFNWALYETLRSVEREAAFQLLKWAVDTLPPPWDDRWKQIGRKPYSARALTIVTIWQEIEGKPERAYTADLERDKSHLQMLGLAHAPHRTAIYRTRKKLSEEYMNKLNHKILENLKRSARNVGADATGLRQSKRDCAWSATNRGGQRGYAKVHGLFDLEAGTIEAFAVTAGNERECSRLEGLLSGLDEIECLVADAGYLSRRNCNVVAAKGGLPYIRPKKNVRWKSRGSFAWSSMVWLFRERPWLFYGVYRFRRRVEAGWHSLKSIAGDFVRGKTFQTAAAEIWSKILCHNLIWAIRGSYGF
jgi:transposase